MKRRKDKPFGQQRCSACGVREGHRLLSGKIVLVLSVGCCDRGVQLCAACIANRRHTPRQRAGPNPMSGLDQYAMRSLDDWRFFYQRAKAGLGIHGIDYERMSLRASGGSVYVAEPDDERQAVARRHARIEAALRRMPDPGVHLVRLTCEDEPRELWQVFGQAGLGNAAHLAQAAVRGHRASGTTRQLWDWLDRLAEKIRSGRATIEGRVLRERIVQGVEQLVVEAHEMYDGARRLAVGGSR